MPLHPSLVGTSYPPTDPYLVTRERVTEFAAATGGTWTGGPVPATFPIVLAFDAMHTFLAAESVELHRIVHGEQRFAYQRPLSVGDELRATLTVASLRQIGGNDVVGTRSEVTDADGALVCTASATLVHRGAQESS
jgi:acyl dehydratase